MELARTASELLRWRRPNGRLRASECREFLERLDADRGGWCCRQAPGPRRRLGHLPAADGGGRAGTPTRRQHARRRAAGCRLWPEPLARGGDERINSRRGRGTSPNRPSAAAGAQTGLTARRRPRPCSGSRGRARDPMTRLTARQVQTLRVPSLYQIDMVLGSGERCQRGLEDRQGQDVEAGWPRPVHGTHHVPSLGNGQSNCRWAEPMDARPVCGLSPTRDRCEAHAPAPCSISGTKKARFTTRRGENRAVLARVRPEGRALRLFGAEGQR